MGLKERRARGRAARRKGQAGEREAASELSRLFGVTARRGRQHKGTDESPDVEVAIPGLHVEVKRAEETLSVYKAVEQAVNECGSNLPLVLHRRNRKPWLAVVRLDDLPELAARLYLVLEEHS